MIAALIDYPHIDPVLVHLGPLAIRWYALSYITGLLLGWGAIVLMLREPQLWTAPVFGGRPPATEDEIGDLVVWTTLGVIIGGRIGFVLIYGTFFCGIWGTSPACAGLPMGYLEHPIKIIAAWEGGMSFHGGMIGTMVALYFFCRKRGLDYGKIGDLFAVVTPIGLFFGRLANFINGELWGKPTDVPWAMIFCNDTILHRNFGICPAGTVPRHPSQLYEAALEGLLLFVILQIALRVFHAQRRPGFLVAIFFTGYALFRGFVELYRDSDTVYFGFFSVGMSLSIPMFAIAAYFYWYAFREKRA